MKRLIIKIDEKSNEKLIQRVNNLLEKTDKYEETQDLDELKKNHKVNIIIK
jgi:hypothetical protein